MYRLKSFLEWMFKDPSQDEHNQLLKKEKVNTGVKMESLHRLKEELTKEMYQPAVTFQEDRERIRAIRETTRGLNRNNVIRTEAYLSFYNKHPEVHWAFLAHMVSRNGGWNMTDLKGSLLQAFIPKKDQIHYFHFLEKANQLIFDDAYSQLLVYEQVKQMGDDRPLSYLPLLNVSRFMCAVWRTFLATGDSAVLTIGLIINEQHLIEKPVIQHPVFHETVFKSWKFQLQDLLSLTRVIFPYELKGRIRLSGLTVSSFDEVSERIMIGKKLYSLLFDTPLLTVGALSFANKVPHTASRSDYWPHMFSKNRESVTGNEWHSCFENADPFLYSPVLTDAWSDKKPVASYKKDWFHNTKVPDYFSSASVPGNIDVTSDYCEALRQMVLLKEAKSAVF
ncbi:DUF2515 family protein [Alteribacter keqinensis]|uniref:DUF2515 domain-containing protein n=1 Tax=Alteribacter keqinensis TaxID=2483800 RepID=A0A3M7TUJ4_9BACI|nr:DUF2515 family protein [Alteribacter keqinensis]RNA69326.1 DUF2515 domain-containing protein [Alteribacter keqinensis]